MAVSTASGISSARKNLLSAFAGLLAELRLACGKPTYAALENTVLRRATMSDVLGGKVNPALDFVVAYVRACLSYAEAHGHEVPEPLADEDRWRERWLRLQRDLGELRRSTAAVTAGVLPRQLPLAPAPFLGRDAEMRRLDDVLQTAREGGYMPIVVLDGIGGAGKTALAVTWGHRRAARFPDGQLFADLAAFGPSGQAAPDHVLSRFLRDLGSSDEQIPVTADGLASRFRSLMAGRKALLILDNAASAQQVGPLLPAAPGCMVVVTSRMTLSALAISRGVTRVAVGPLPAAESVTLLRRLGAPDGVSALRLAEECAHLPLALRIVAERLTQEGHTDVSVLIEELRAGVRGADLTPFQSPDGDAGTALRTVFSWSYHALAPPAARAFRLLSRHGPGGFGVPATAALLAVPEADAARLLADLRGAHLVETENAHRYRLHDLLRAYAAELAAARPEAGRAAAGRLIQWYLYTLDNANQRLLPGWPRRAPLEPRPRGLRPAEPADYDAALAWCDLELSNVVAMVRRAADLRWDRLAWRLAYSLLPYFNLRKPWPVWIAAFELGEAAARRAGETVGVAGLVNGLGIAHKETGQLAEARWCYETAVDLYRELGDGQGEGLAVNNLSTLAGDEGRHEAAIELARAALARFGEVGDVWGTAIALHNIADNECVLGRYDVAFDHVSEAIALCESMADQVGVAHGLTTLGLAWIGLGDHAAALDALNRALHLRTEQGDERGVAITLWYLGRAYAAAGDAGTARRRMTEALARLERIGDRLGRHVSAELSAL